MTAPTSPHVVAAQADIAGDVREIARRLGAISERTVWSLISRGELSAVKVGRRTLITEQELQRFVTQLVTRSR